MEPPLCVPLEYEWDTSHGSEQFEPFSNLTSSSWNVLSLDPCLQRNETSPISTPSSNGITSPANNYQWHQFNDKAWKEMEHLGNMFYTYDNAMFENPDLSTHFRWDSTWAPPDTGQHNAYQKSCKASAANNNTFNKPCPKLQSRSVVKDQLEWQIDETDTLGDRTINGESWSSSDPILETGSTFQAGKMKPKPKSHQKSSSMNGKNSMSKKKMHKSSTAPTTLQNSSAIEPSDEFLPLIGLTATGSNTKNSRISHNMIEKQYRMRLNNGFRVLLDKIPQELVDSKIKNDEAPKRKISKGETLELALEYIRFLEKEGIDLSIGNEGLSHEEEISKRQWLSLGGAILS